MERFGNFDLIIIGSGPAGLSAAQRALQHGLRVLNLDWGAHAYPHYSALLNSDETFLTGGIGGSALHWGAQFGVLSDIDTFNWGVTSGFSKVFFDKLDEAVHSISRDLGIDESQLTVDYHPSLRGSGVLQRERHTFFPKQKDITRIFAKTISNPNYRHFDDLKLNWIEVISDKSRVLHFETGAVEIESTPLLIAVGCMETTRIIYKSLQSINVSIPEIGKYLADHPSKMGSRFRIVRNGKALPADLFKSESKQKKEISIFRSNLGIYQTGIYEIRTDVIKICKNPMNSYFYSQQNLRALFLKAIFLKRLSKLKRTHYYLWYQIEQLRSCESTICLDGRTDTSNWKLSPEDFELFLKLEEVAESEMANYSLIKVTDVQKANEDEVFQAFHPSGTVPVGLDPRVHVVNHFGKLHLIPNTWVASSATFPTASWINPSLIIMAMGQLAVDDIKVSMFGK